MTTNIPEPDYDTSVPPLATAYGFVTKTLKEPLHHWQARFLSAFDRCPLERVKVSLCTPNGAGKSAKCVSSLVLLWLYLFPRGKVVLTSKSGLQLDTQVQPALRAHQAKFPDWKFIDRQITTPTGGLAIMFTTDEPGRAEGHHPVGDAEQGPVLIIVDEAKSVGEEIFQALDRCTWNAMVYVSSAGQKVGRFYDSHYEPEMGFMTMRVGLKDCPHIPQERIDDIRRTYGPKHPFTLSTLDGQFMDAEGELRFDLDGLDYLLDQVIAEEEAQKSDEPEILGKTARIGFISEQDRGRFEDSLSFVEVPDGWIWMSERPIPGCEYIAFCDPMTGEQSEGAKKRDTHAAGILRKAYIRDGVEYDMEMVACCHWPGGCRWYNDVLADRLSLLMRFYGDPLCICESNNSGTEVMRLLMNDGRRMWRREKPNHRVPGRRMIDVVGFNSTGTTKSLWIGALSTAIKERTLICKYRQAVEHMRSFILDENGRGAAQAGCHDDFVTGLGLGIYALPANGTVIPEGEPLSVGSFGHGGGSYFGHGEGAGPFS